MIFALTLTVTVCLFLAGLTVAVSADGTKSGSCGAEGDSVSWVLNTKTGVLQISGAGKIADYSATATVGSNAAPWRSYASSVKSLIIKEGITGIGKNAFSGLTKLETLALPEGLTAIGENAFLYCASLSTLEIPSSVTDIGEKAFANCGSIESITVGAGNTVYRSEANCLIQISNETVIRGSLSVSLPENVRYIGDYAFSGCGIKTATLPDSVVYMGYGVFAECSSIEELTLPFVGDCRLDKNEAPTCTHPSESDSEVRGKYKNTLWYLFGDKGTPDSLKKVTLTDTEVIGAEAFADSASLTTVVLPDSLKIISDAAFDGCSSLSSVSLPKKLEKIGREAFKDCASVTAVEIPDSVTAIASLTFDGCVKLESVKIGSGISGIGEGSFYRCPSLVKLEVSDENTVYYEESGCIIEKATVKLVVGCKNSVIPDNVKTIGVGAFKNCISLTTVTLPAGLVKIEASAFESCTGLTEIIVPDSVTEIGEAAFSGCVGLKSVKIPQNVKVGDSAFKNCTSLDSSSLYVYSGSWGASDKLNNSWIWWIVAGASAAAVAAFICCIIIMKKKK